MHSKLRIAMAQINFMVGDIEGNTDTVIAQAIQARDVLKADLVVFPELTLTGYPPEDLLLRADLHLRVDKALLRIKEQVSGIDIILGYPQQTINGCYNVAALIRNGETMTHYHKQHLPNYSVFDEKRYFQPGATPCIVYVKKIPIAITICEDLWHPAPTQQAVKAGAKLIVSLNASPFNTNKVAKRKKILQQRARDANVPILYVNWVGGQDELVFDGGSLAINEDGNIQAHAGFYKETLLPVDIAIHPHLHLLNSGHIPPQQSDEESIYNALVLGVRDYIKKNHFPGAVIGLSGGIDSALTLAIAVDAIGKEQVDALMMPSRYTAKISLEDAKTQATTLGVTYKEISIEPTFKAFLESLREEFAGLPADTAEENLQARCRGVLLMAISNKKNYILLSTGNKSEIAIGYTTLYGDTAGGFCVLKDVPKTWVYRLANYRNSLSLIIPERVIDRPPSAELTSHQKDQDTLPPYPILDQILERYIEKDQSIRTITDAGFDEDMVRRIVARISQNEYKRRQAPPGVRITTRAFGRDRRYPITSGFRKSPKDQPKKSGVYTQ